MKTVVTSVLLLMGLVAGVAHAAPPAPKAEKDTVPVRVAKTLPKEMAGQQRPKAHEKWIVVESVAMPMQPKADVVRAETPRRP